MFAIFPCTPASFSTLNPQPRTLRGEVLRSFLREAKRLIVERGEKHVTLENDPLFRK